MIATISLADLNAMAPGDFVHSVGGVFERSPWIAERVAAARPFASVDALHRAMSEAVRRASLADQLSLLRAHPELAPGAEIVQAMTIDSRSEQRGAGLDRCTPEQRDRFATLNARYRERFGFPFILAVAGYDVDGILREFERRHSRPIDDERNEALRQVARIARTRLEALIAS